MERILPEEIKGILKILKDTSFIITGSYALYLQGKLQRKPDDLDLISNDSGLLDKLKSVCDNYSDIIENNYHHRFLYNQKLFIDVFSKPRITKIIPIEFGEYNLKVSHYSDVYIRKLLSLKLNTKDVTDIISYFEQVVN